MKHVSGLVPLVLAFAPAYGAEEPLSKADCDAALTAEVKRLEEGFSRTREAWEKSVDQRFADHVKEFTSTQMESARATFNGLMVKLSSEHLKAVALPGIYRMMLAVPQYDVEVCSKPVEMRAVGDQAIVGFLLKLTLLLPLVEKSLDAAKADG